MEALQQRHEELTKRGEEAATKGDSAKARRMERLSKVLFSYVYLIYNLRIVTSVNLIRIHFVL